MSTKRDFSGKVVLITGSSSGIGAVAAEEFAKAGAQVVITGRDFKKLTDIGKRCLKASPQNLEPLEVAADISNEEDCHHLIDSTIKTFEKLDVLVNNAGSATFSSVENPAILETFDNLMRINVRSVIHLTHLSVKHLEKTKGNIVNVSSCVGIKPFPFITTYCMTKCALDMFTKCAALELAPKGIRVNSVNPARVRTNFGRGYGMDQKSFDERLASDLPKYPLGRLGESLDVANQILHLASDDCSWTTGTIFVTDGGMINS